MCEKLFTTRVDCLLHILTDHDVDKRDARNFVLNSGKFSTNQTSEVIDVWECAGIPTLVFRYVKKDIVKIIKRG